MQAGKRGARPDRRQALGLSRGRLVPERRGAAGRASFQLTDTRTSSPFVAASGVFNLAPTV